MTRARLLAVLLLASTAAAAYIPPLSSLLRRAASRSGSGKAQDTVLSGTFSTAGGPAQPATLTLNFPLTCRLDVRGGEGAPGAVIVRGDAAKQQAREEGAPPGARDLLRLACPLIAYRGMAMPEGMAALRSVAETAGVDFAVASLSRLEDRPAWVLGAGPNALEQPQLWLYKENHAPARLVVRGGAGTFDLRLLEYGNPAAGEWFPRVLELWTGGKQAARFEALETRGASGGDDEAADEGE